MHVTFNINGSQQMEELKEDLEFLEDVHKN